jgi:formylglycine-generating enzyme required for sulfatase activity
MGSTSAEIDAAMQRCEQARSDWRRETFDREAPVREVTLDPFLLDRTEVTNEDYARWLSSREVEVERGRLVRSGGVLLLDLEPGQGGIEQAPAGGFIPRPGRARKPVVQVTWFGADRYCRDHGQRLPTEAEWEYAARGAMGRPFPWGEREPACGQVVFGRAPGTGCSGDPGPDEVGAAPGDTTPEGIRDLGGNVAEWVADAFVTPYPACGADCHNPTQAGPEQGKLLRVIRGGDWREPANACRAAGRAKGDQGGMRTNVGFRCARSNSVKP